MANAIALDGVIAPFRPSVKAPWGEIFLSETQASHVVIAVAQIATQSEKLVLRIDDFEHFAPAHH
jgi:hypothetical protein